MLHRMNRIRPIMVATMAAVLASAAACNTDRLLNAHAASDRLISRIAAMGFSTVGIVDAGDYFVVEVAVFPGAGRVLV